MNNIVVITDREDLADMEFKALRHKLTDNGLLTSSDSRYRLLHTPKLIISFWNVNSGGIYNFDTIAYSNCKIGLMNGEPIKYQIEKWRRIEKLIEGLMPNIEEIPYSCIESLEIFEKYQSQTKALKNYGINVSKEAVDKYALENLGRIPQNQIKRDSARDCKIVEEFRRIEK